MKVLDSRRTLTGFATVVFFSALAADAWRNSIGWYGYAVVVVVLAVASVLVLVRHRALRLDRVPWPLVAFLALAAASTIWSFYPLYTLGATITQLITTAAGLAIALVLSIEEIVVALARALRAILALSLLFELVVALIVRAPVFPVWVTAEDRVDPPMLLYWSRNLLLEGDRIQGIVGSSSLLAMAALVGLIVFSVQLAHRSVSRFAGVASIVLAVLTIGLTRSATIYLGLIAVAVVLGAILVLRRISAPAARRRTYLALAAASVILIAAAITFRGPLLAAFGKNAELTGRVGIWEAVIGLAQQRPAVGWGWISFWPPWIEPFDGLVTRAGVQQLHAHNAWLDVWLQLGVVGLVVFGALVVTTAIRSWLLATDRVIRSPHSRGEFSTLSLLAPLLLTALLVQSLAESRLLLEGGWLLLVVIATSTRLGMVGRLDAPLAREQVRRG